MEKILDIFNISFEEGQSIDLLEITNPENGIDVYKFQLSWTAENAFKDDSFVFMWHVPILSDLYKLSPTCGENRFLPPNWDWRGYEKSMISLGAPFCSHYNGSGKNRYTWCVSECSKTILFKSGVLEEEGTLENNIKVSLKQYTNQLDTTIYLYIDTRNININKSISEISLWWAKEFGIKPALPPDNAFDPVYSFWYSYHQNITDKVIEEECRRAKDLGFDICIVDDGWQTDDNNRGYAHCGDWEPTQNKFPDIKEHIKTVHQIGMKYILWFNVPCMGKFVVRYEEFKDMFLCWYDGQDFGALDPRYKKVRDYLISIYKNALLEWDLDGFKFDFIDVWQPGDSNAPYNPDMDIPELSDAVDVFMTDIITSLKEIKPDLLIEFRQSYIGPYMRKYGYMFRVSDCPYDYNKNRVGICDLRILMPGSAVHSDMLMWHKDMAADLVAVQIINVMFGVLQYSARLDEITEEQAKMSKFWISFLKEHKALLLLGEFMAYDPHLSYTWAKSTLGDECAVGAFAVDKCVKPDNTDIIYIANGSTENRVIVDLLGDYNVSVIDHFGNEIRNYNNQFSGVEAINIPFGGLCVLKRFK